MKNLTIRDLLKNIDFDSENANLANFRSIIDWNSKEISDFFDKNINVDFNEEEYYALGYFLFIQEKLLFQLILHQQEKL